MSKLREDVRVGMLGAAGGVFSFSVFLLVARVDAHYAYMSWLEKTNYATYERGVENLWWLPIVFWHVLLSVVASFLTHRYLAASQKSPFLLWQVVGTIALLGWAPTLSVILGLEYLMYRDIDSLERTLRSVDAGYTAKYFAAIFASNVLFGSALEAASRQYAEKEAP